MKFPTIIAMTALLGASLPGTAATFDLGVLDTTKPLMHVFTDFTGTFTDIYTFTLGSTATGMSGDTTTLNFGEWWNVNLTSAQLTGAGLSTTLSDSYPNDGFSFSGLTSGGSYTLSINGEVTGTGLAGSTGMYAGYVSAVPEPETIGLALAGLLATGVALRRRAR